MNTNCTCFRDLIQHSYCKKSMIPYVRCHHDRKQYLVKTPTAIDFAKEMIGAVLQHKKQITMKKHQMN